MKQTPITSLTIHRDGEYSVKDNLAFHASVKLDHLKRHGLTAWDAINDYFANH